MTKVRFKTTSEAGLTPGGRISPENLLRWLDKRIVECNERIETSGMNGESNGDAEGGRDAYRKVKSELFGKVYDT